MTIVSGRGHNRQSTTIPMGESFRSLPKENRRLVVATLCSLLGISND